MSQTRPAPTILLLLLPLSAAAQPDYRLRFDVNLVQVDAIVTDKAGRHVPDLLRDDFTVHQDGRERPITHFMFVPEAPAAAPSPAASPHSLRKEDVRRAFAIVFDDGQMGFSEFAVLRQGLLRFLDSGLQPGDLWALFRTSGGSGASRVFSSDPRQIRSGVERMRWLHPPPAHLASIRFRVEIDAAINRLTALPGRKALILVNGGFDDPALFDIPVKRLGLDRNPFPPDFVRRLTDHANRASVVIYAIDSRGVAVTAGMPDNWLEASQPSKSYDRSTVPARFPRPLLYYASQIVPRDLTFATGGLMFANRNDCDEQFRQVRDDNAGYYLLGWNPGPGAFTGRSSEYHPIRIKVRRPGMKVRTRAGFFETPGDLAPPPDLSPHQAIRQALGAPFRSGGINVHLRASFQVDRGLGPIVESLIHIAPERLAFSPGADGCRIASLEALSTALPLDAPSGPAPEIHTQTGSFEICGRTLERALREGLVYVLRDPVKRPGPYEMHVAVRTMAPGEAPSGGQLDPGTFGSASEFVDVPDLSREDLALSGIRIEDARSADSSTRLTRPPIDRDPVIRVFHQGEPVPFQAGLLGRLVNAPSVDWSRISCRLTILHEGTKLEEQTFRLKGPRIAGGYRTSAATPPGQYVLELAVALAGRKPKAASQWTTFSVEP